MYKFRYLLESTKAAVRMPCFQFLGFRHRDVSFLPVIHTCKMLGGNPVWRYESIAEVNVKPLKTEINTNYI
jgi:hypothetical protein